MPVQARSDPHEHGRQPTGPKPAVNRRGNSKPKPISRTVTGTGNVHTRRGSKQTIKQEPRTKVEPKSTEMSESKSLEAKLEDKDGQQEEKGHEIENGETTTDRYETEITENGSHEDSEKQQLGNTRFRPLDTATGEENQEDANTECKVPTPLPEPEVFTIEKFNNTMENFVDKFSSSKFLNVGEEYPVDDLISVVTQVTESVEEYKQQTLSSQQHLDELRNKMKDVKHSIQQNIEKRSNAIRMNDESQSIEERELSEKLARLNAQVAQANAELAEALRLSTETESKAVEAQLAAERAKEEAKNIEEELAFKAKVEERRKEQEKKKQDEERKKMEEERLREEEKRREKEAEWKRKEHGLEKPSIWENWPCYEYRSDDGSELCCIIRGHPNSFNQNSVTCGVLDQMTCPVPFKDHEELVSSIINISSSDEQDSTRKTSIVVCIPYKAPKQVPGHNSREAVIKLEHNGQWECVETREEVLEQYKDYRFAVTETKHLTKMAVFHRLKRDYATISNRGGKMTSSFDQRISLSIPKDCISGRDHLLMEDAKKTSPPERSKRSALLNKKVDYLTNMKVQPVDSNSVNDLKNKSKNCKGLLTSSPIINMVWESSNFKQPVTVTIPCPPNPVKAKKLAALRKQKEEQMKNPPKVQVLLPHEIEALEKEKAKSKLQKMQEQIAAEENPVEEPKPTKWYMGEYANNEDDENDNLFLVSCQGNNKWTPVDNVNIMQVKLDLLQFDLDKPLERFMVLRTKTNVPEESVSSIADEMSKFLSQKFVQVILKQKTDDPFDTMMSVVPSIRTEKTLKKMAEEGYEEGPEPSPVLSINEGDVIEVGFRGNITNRNKDDITFIYNSNLESEAEFYACEVDKYLQKNFPVYRGVVEVYRKFKVKNQQKRKRKDSTDDPDVQQDEMKRELLCDLAINIPKYHVEQNSTVLKAPITIRNTSDPVNENLMRYVADELGDEWRIVANHLNVSKPRIQAILRNMQYGDQTESDAKYDMLMTWLKKTPKAMDKVTILSSALLKSGRGDIAEEVKAKDREFREHTTGFRE